MLIIRQQLSSTIAVNIAIPVAIAISVLVVITHRVRQTQYHLPWFIKANLAQFTRARRFWDRQKKLYLTVLLFFYFIIGQNKEDRE